MAEYRTVSIVFVVVVVPANRRARYGAICAIIRDFYFFPPQPTHFAEVMLMILDVCD